MGKLALIGAAILGFHATPITQAQATRAIRADGRFAGEQVTSCVPNASGTSCDVVGSICFVDSTFGNSTLVGVTTVEVSRGRRGFRVAVTAPDQFVVYAASGCNSIGT